MDLKGEILKKTEDIYLKVKDLLVLTTRDEIVTTNGTLSTGHEAAKRGSFVYLLYDKNLNLLYVGETGTTIKKRLVQDGGGSHHSKNPEMYNETKYVKYLKTSGISGLSEMDRKFIEQALSIHLKPKYYGRK